MPKRKEVFQEKVLQRLYPLSPMTEKVQRSGDSDGSGPKNEKTCLRVKAKADDVIDEGKKNSLPPRRVYTVLPPPDGFQAGGEERLTPPEPGDMSSEGETADEDDPLLSGEGRQKRRRRRRKKAGGVPEGDAIEGRAGGAGPGTGTGGDAKLSKNKKRKLKKKRHKEKMLSLGLLLGPAAIEFTYQPGPDGEGQGPGAGEQSAAQLLDFFRATQEIYLSEVTPRVPFLGLQGLLTRLSRDAVRPPDLALLLRLKSLVLLRDTGRLASELEEFQQNSDMSSEETAVVCSLFRYWITDILPMWTNEKSAERTA